MAPRRDPRSFDWAAARRDRDVFNGPARCAECHVPPLFTEPGQNLYGPEETDIDSFQADRAPQRGYRTSPLEYLKSL